MTDGDMSVLQEAVMKALENKHQDERQVNLRKIEDKQYSFVEFLAPLGSGSSGPGSSPGRGHCVVFFGKTRLSPPRCINGKQRTARTTL